MTGQMPGKWIARDLWQSAKASFWIVLVAALVACAAAQFV